MWVATGAGAIPHPGCSHLLFQGLSFPLFLLWVGQPDMSIQAYLLGMIHIHVRQIRPQMQTQAKNGISKPSWLWNREKPTRFYGPRRGWEESEETKSVVLFLKVSCVFSKYTKQCMSTPGRRT
jgi:hypothetical protein